VSSFDISIGDALPIIGLLVVILVLAFYPQFGLRRSESTVRAAVAPAQAQQVLQASARAHQVAQVP
jgi:NADH:ubiquinone oxidoreductase subunit 4 (subunit M)